MGLRPSRAAGLALLFTALQILAALILAPGHRGQIPAPLTEFPGELKTRYLQLNNWDSQHYRDIARRGYVLPAPVDEISSDDVHRDRANVGFFPAYPMLGRWLSQITGLTVETSLLIVAQIACWGFWTYFFLLLGSFGLNAQAALGLGILTAAYPTMFFLVTGYSESIFMATLLGMIFWTEKALSARGRGIHWIFAGCHGFGLTASRLVGLPLAVYPAARALFARERSIGRLLSGSVASALAIAGLASFFLYCHWKFGIWNLYILLQQKGWHNLPDYLALLKPTSYLPYFFFEDTMDSISRASIPFVFALLLGCGWKDYRTGGWTGFRERLPLYGIAFLMFYVNLSGKANAKMDSMSRYTFPVYVLVVLGWAWFQRRGVEWTRGRRIWVGLGFALQAYLAFMFLRGNWVA